MSLTLALLRATQVHIMQVPASHVSGSSDKGRSVGVIDYIHGP